MFVVLISIYAALLMLAGAGLLFVPETLLSGSEAASLSLVVQLLGAGFIGLGISTWLARRSALGGIYGRAVVGGTQAFSFIGSLVLLRGFDPAAGWTYWLLLGLLGYGAVLFSILLFKGPRLPTSATPVPGPHADSARV